MRAAIPSARFLRRRRVRLDLLLGVLVVVVVAAAFLVHRGAANPQSTSVGSPRPAAEAFAGGYLSYLEGHLRAGSLPDSNNRVRTLAAGAPPIPPGARRGALRLTGIRITYVRGAVTAQAVALGRDRAHVYGFQLALRYVNARWEVVYLIPPDVGTITAQPYRPPVPVPALQRAAAAFALAYAGYREGTRAGAPAGLPTVAQQIAAGRDPLANATPSHVRPHLVSISLGPVVNGNVAARAVVGDRGRRFRFGFDLAQSARGWQASGFPEAG